MPSRKASRIKFSQKEFFLVAAVLIALVLAGLLAYKKAPAKRLTNTKSVSTESPLPTPTPTPTPLPPSGSTADMIRELSAAAESEDSIAAESSKLEAENVKPEDAIYAHIGDSLNDTAF